MLGFHLTKNIVKYLAEVKRNLGITFLTSSIPKAVSFESVVTASPVTLPQARKPNHHHLTTSCAYRL